MREHTDIPQRLTKLRGFDQKVIPETESIMLNTAEKIRIEKTGGDTKLPGTAVVQAGADRITYDAACYIMENYLKETEFSLVPVDTSKESLGMEHNVIGYSAIRRQTEKAYSILKEQKVSKIFTVGGGCDADAASILYLNELYQGDLAVLWFDAHGDINAPEESDTHLFYGMPVRSLLGECGESFPMDRRRRLHPDQIINIGGRDLDDAETAYMEKHGIIRIPAQTDYPEKAILEAVSKTNKKHVYIHFDLDVLEPSEFPATPVPYPGGMHWKDAIHVLNQLKGKFPIAGFGLYEYVPDSDPEQKIKPFIDFGLSLL